MPYRDPYTGQFVSEARWNDLMDDLEEEEDYFEEEDFGDWDTFGEAEY